MEDSSIYCRKNRREMDWCLVWILDFRSRKFSTEIFRMGAFFTSWGCYRSGAGYLSTFWEIWFNRPNNGTYSAKYYRSNDTYRADYRSSFCKICHQKSKRNSSKAIKQQLTLIAENSDYYFSPLKFLDMFFYMLTIGYLPGTIYLYL